MLDHPPELPPNGFLLADLDYIPEPLAAIALDTAPQTLIKYRKLGCGPEYTLLGRRILYSRAKLQAWLETGGTRGCDERILNPVSVAKPVQPDVQPRHQQRRRTAAARRTWRSVPRPCVKASAAPR